MNFTAGTPLAVLRNKLPEKYVIRGCKKVAGGSERLGAGEKLFEAEETCRDHLRDGGPAGGLLPGGQAHIHHFHLNWVV